jgi:drug/metabolite transporter (DMT)-like permease
MVDINSNPLYYAAIGGIIIGIATSLNYALRGSVTGMSGMVYGTVNLDKSIFYLTLDEMPKNIAIIGGMLLAGGIFFDIFGYERYNNF